MDVVTIISPNHYLQEGLQNTEMMLKQEETLGHMAASQGHAVL